MRRQLAAFALMICLSSPATAFKEQWVAESGAAKTIIGALTVDINGNIGQIIFANGKRLPLKRVGNASWLFSVDPPQDPILRRGTRLCGIAPITFVALKRGSGYDRSLEVFTGEKPAACAYYPLYEKKGYGR